MLGSGVGGSFEGTVKEVLSSQKDQEKYTKLDMYLRVKAENQRIDRGPLKFWVRVGEHRYRLQSLKTSSKTYVQERGKDYGFLK